MLSRSKIYAVCLAIFALLAVLSTAAFAQFSSSAIELPGGVSGAFAWGDYDSDGDLDFATAGLRGTSRITRVYRNDGSGVFTLVASLTGVSNAALAWGDYDADGDLDLAFCGQDATGTPITKLYRYDGGVTFTDTAVSLVGLTDGSMVWGDFNNDGRLDLLYTGNVYSGSSYKLYTRQYRNNGDGTFTSVNPRLPGLVFASIAAVDYDNDGNLDLAMTGGISTGEAPAPYSAVFHGNGDGSFAQAEVKLPQLMYSSIAWADWDNDGLFDLAIAGEDGEALPRMYVFHQNDIDRFEEVGPRVQFVKNCSLAWGDFDNDGIVDLAAIGTNSERVRTTKVYHGFGNGNFEDIGFPFVGMDQGTTAWGDFNNDGKLDLAVVGATDSSSALLIYQNIGATANTAPTAPTNLSARVSGNDFTFSWNDSEDAQTPSKGLTYNISIGTSSTTAGVVSPMANSTTGYRRIPAYGNAQKRRDITIKGLTGQTYYYKVQAIDTAFAGSSWSVTGQITRYKISGYAKTVSGTAMAGVTVSANNNGGSAVTDAAGYYELMVISGWSGSVTPKKNGFAFSPESRSLSNVISDRTNQDFTVPAFQSITTSLPSVSSGTAIWGDYDNDGDLDVLASGTIGGVKATKLYRNTAGVFADTGSSFVGVTQACAAWGDYDNDGDLDIAVGGSLDSGCTTRIYRNDSGTFVDINAGIDGIWDGSLAWGDYDNDGYADLAITGGASSGYITKVYRNNRNGTFTDVNAGMTGMASGSLAWADSDNDGDLDLLTVGGAGVGPNTKFYKNNGNGTFTSATSPAVAGWQSAIAWGDYDNDGDLDVVEASNEGTTPPSPVTRIFRNNNDGTFTSTNPGIIGLYEPAVDWGDMDNDGDLDLAICGISKSGTTYTYTFKVYRNDGGNVWTDMNLGFVGVAYGSVAWGDCDNDGDLDLIVSGTTQSYSANTVIYINNGTTLNTVPTAPSGLASTGGPSSVTFSWGAASDTQTTANGLSYNLRVGTAAGKDDVFSSQAFTSGRRKLPAIGNAQKKLSWSIKNLPGRTYYWSVQAIDAAHAGGAWAAEQTFVLPKITGYVHTMGGTPLAGVTVTASNGGTSAVTDSQGAYAVAVPPNWSGTVTASFGTWSFQPPSISFTGVVADQVNQNYIAQRFKISGFVKKADGTAVLDASVVADNGGTAWSTNALGAYEVYVPSGWTGTITPSKPGWSFNPASAPYNGVSADLTAQDFTAIPPVFGDSGLPLINVDQADSAWGDYDNDGDLDLVLCGRTLINGVTSDKSKIYRNNGDGTFTDIAASIDDVSDAAAAWGDYDGDGDLDLALYGRIGYSGGHGKIYRNDGNGVFTDSGVVLANLNDAAIAWGDYDCDGDLDLLANGSDSNDYKCYVFRNDKNGTFTPITPSGIPAVSGGSNVWGDYDNDGDLDIAVAGYARTEVFKNDGTGRFTSINAGLPQAYYASLDWGDFDNDGDLDLAECANFNSSVGLPYTKVYRNDGGRFYDIGAPFVGVGMGQIEWGDFNSDGYLDLAVTGSKGDYITYAPDTRIYKNNGDGSFSDFQAGLVGVHSGTTSWADFDNDGDLDLLVAGSTGTTFQSCQPLTKLYINNAGSANTAPTTPGGLAASIANGGLRLSWTAATDAQTASAGLSYNIRIGTAPGQNDAVPGMSMSTGSRLLPALGNAQKKLNWVTKNLQPGYTYYCAVQSIDSSGVGSPWSAEVSISLYSISGYVKTAQGAPIVGATVIGSGNIGQIKTDANGYYQLSVPTGWSGTFTASKDDWQFSPANILFTNVTGSLSNQNFTALRHKISGTVKRSGGSPVVNALITYSPGASCYTDSNGYYEFFVAPGWTGKVTSTANGYLFNPDSRSYTNLSTDMPNQNFVDRPPLFSPISSMIDQVRYGAVAWGDYDNDGYLDLALTGETYSGRVAKLYHNDGYGEFAEVPTGFTGVNNSAVAWGDYDGDGDLDLVVAGEDSSLNLLTKIYRNDGYGTFVDIGASLAPMKNGAVSWADYDNDGDLDLAVSGYTTGSNAMTKLYRNVGNGVFTDTLAAIAPMSSSSMSWADYDRDGDLDLAICGFRWTSPTGAATLIYRNEGAGSFTPISTSAIGVQMGAIAWGDYDNDGDPDLAVTGLDGSNMYMSRIYKNNGNGVFADINAQIPGLYSGSVGWGDYDNDGDLDLLLSGSSSANVKMVRICRNDGDGSFVAMDEGIAAAYESAFGWGDYDNDGDLDIAAVGSFSGQIYRNDITVHNVVPTAPGTVSASSIGNDLTISWTAGADTKTPASGLSYNIRIGSAPGKNDVFAGMADVTSGWRLVPGRGNAQQSLTWTFKSPKPLATYYYAVQAVDTAFAGSAWTEGSTTRYKVSGYVRDQFNLPIKQVTITGSNGAIATTDASGYYEMYVSANWSGTITPSKPTFTFNPTNKVYTNVSADMAGQDFTATAPPFESVGAGLPGVGNGMPVWGDYDNDGDLDLAICGATLADWPYNAKTNIYRNDGSGAFTLTATLPGSSYGAIEWADMDNDDDLDLVFLPGSMGTVPNNTIYMNNGDGSFTNAYLNLGPRGEAVAVGDYNNDGKLDLAVCEYDMITHRVKILRNNGNWTFTDIQASLEGLSETSLSWVDYDDDGDLDLTLTGFEYGWRRTIVYRNTDGAFAAVTTTLPGVDDGNVAWADYDNDGDLDAAICGRDNSDVATYITRVCRNDGNGVFVDIAAGFTGVLGNVSWGDYDNDGDSDLTVTGMTLDHQLISKVYRNNGGSNFTDAGLGLPGVYGTSAWGDYDGDGDLDLIITGGIGNWQLPTPATFLYRNNVAPRNTVPNAPTGLSATTIGSETTFGWNAATDAQTPSKGLAYNLRVGTTPGSDNVLSAMASLSLGTRRCPKVGNALQRLSWTVRGLTGGPYYWSVQSIDSAYAGSAWAAEQNTTFPTGSGMSVQSVKNAADNQPVLLNAGTFGVTALFDNKFYIEDVSRTSGIRVDGAAPGALLNRSVSISGKAMTDPANGERYIKASMVLAGVSQVTTPFGMNNSLIGGGSFGLQQGMFGMSSLNNTGLLVRVYGVPTAETDSTFTLNDGSVPVLCKLPTGMAFSPNWQFITVTGISSCYKTADGLKPVILIRSAADIVAL